VHILFVCTGNTGRSLAAEAIARRRIAAQRLPLTAASRGLAVDPHNNRAEPHIATLLAARGIDLAAHRATGLTDADVRAADAILTMTAAHQRELLRRYPDDAAKVRMLSQAAHDTQHDVVDAFGADLATCQRLVAQLDTLVADALNRLATA